MLMAFVRTNLLLSGSLRAGWLPDRHSSASATGWSGDKAAAGSVRRSIRSWIARRERVCTCMLTGGHLNTGVCSLSGFRAVSV
jgi:hypothetical protein